MYLYYVLNRVLSFLAVQITMMINFSIHMIVMVRLPFLLEKANAMVHKNMLLVLIIQIFAQLKSSRNMLCLYLQLVHWVNCQPLLLNHATRKESCQLGVYLFCALHGHFPYFNALL